MQPPRLADTAERDYSPQRADHYAKTTEGTQKYINVRLSADGLPMMGSSAQLL